MPKPRTISRHWASRFDKNHLASRFARNILFYSITWIALAALTVIVFCIADKSFIWLPDGVYQHFNSFNYACDYFAMFLTGQSIPQFDFTLGQGSDSLTTLGGYDFTDPLTWLAVVLFPGSRQVKYSLLLLFKLYLAGFAFCTFCHAIDHDDTLAVVCGAIAYVFSGALLVFFAARPNFISWAYFLPFILAGIELFLRRRIRWVLILSVAFNAVASIYTLYVDLCLSALYVLVMGSCFIATNGIGQNLKEVFYDGLKLAGLCFTGLMLSSVVLLPMTYAYSINARIGVPTGYTASLLFYPFDYYLQMFSTVFSTAPSFGDSKYNAVLGFNAFLLVPIAIVFARKGNMQLKTCIVACALMLCIPVVGKVLNGFGYVSNRWAFAVTLTACVSLVLVFPRLTRPERWDTRIISITGAVYCMLVLVMAAISHDILAIYSCAVVVATIVMYLIIIRALPYAFVGKAVCVLVLVGCSYQIFATFSQELGDNVGRYIDQGSLEDHTAISSLGAVNLSKDFYRIEPVEQRANVDGYNGTNSSAIWWSLIPSNIASYYTNLGICTVRQNCNIKGLDARSSLLELASVRYYTCLKENTSRVPNGYTEVKSADKAYKVFENPNWLPLGYSYSRYILSSDFNILSACDKDLALLQGAVIDNPIDGFEEKPIESPTTNIGYKIAGTDGVEITEDTLTCTKEKGSVKLTCEIPDDCEVFICIDGPRLAEPSYLSIVAGRKVGDYTSETNGRLSNSNNNWFVDFDSIVFNLSYGHPGKNEITLRFGSECSFSFDNLRVVAVPMSSYREYVNLLRTVVLENCSVKANEVTGTVNAPDSRIMQFSIPYSIGWSIRIDGKPGELFKSGGGMYLATVIPPGEHSVTLEYRTPFLFLGLVVSSITALALVSLVLIRLLRSKSERTGKHANQAG